MRCRCGLSEVDRAEIGKSLECFDRVECVVSYLPERAR